MVTSIIAVVAAITLPRLQNAAATSRLAAVERLVQAEVQQLLDAAFANDQLLTIVFDTANDTITITDSDAGTPDAVIELRSDAYRVDMTAADADGSGANKTTLDPRSDSFPGIISFTISAGSASRVVATSNQTSPTTAERSRLLGDRSPAAMDPIAAGGSVAGDGR